MGTGASKDLKRLVPYAKNQYPHLEKLKNSMLITDYTKPDNPIVYANDDFERLTLYPKEEIVGKNCRFLQGRHTSKDSVELIRDAIKNAIRRDIVLLNYRKDGMPFWNNFGIMPLRADPTDDSKVTHFIGIQRDITPIKQANRELHKWTSVEVALWAETLDLWEYALLFIDHNVTGRKLITMTVGNFKFDIGMPPKVAQSFHKHVESLVKKTEQGKSIVFKTRKQARFVAKAFYEDQRRVFFVLEHDTLAAITKRIRTVFPGKFITQEVVLSWNNGKKQVVLEDDNDVANAIQATNKSTTMHLFVSRRKANISLPDLELSKL
mmetsp:Transcript_17279/g.19262  ORF Transcript_17279/g.19262 Transcript_17279/m.19262 type:complete len:322 (-) Transcript_17279:384-1349(-)